MSISTGLTIIGLSGALAAVVGLLLVGLGWLAGRERHSEPDPAPEAPARGRTGEERTQALAALAPMTPESRAEEEWKAEVFLFAACGAEDLRHFRERTIKILTDFLGEPYVIADSFDQLRDMFDGTPTESFAKVE